MKRTELREHIFKMLFQIEFNEMDEMPEHLQLYFASLENATEQDKEYIENKYHAVVEKVSEIDDLINEKCEGYKINCT